MIRGPQDPLIRPALTASENDFRLKGECLETTFSHHGYFGDDGGAVGILNGVGARNSPDGYQG
jgi:hypothetical protein